MDAVRTCRDCLRPQPLGEFRRRSRGGEARFHQCRDCRNRAERNRRRRQRVDADRRSLRGLLAVAGRTSDRRRLERVCEELLRICGGLDGLQRAWTEFFLSAQRRGGLDALRCYEALFRMLDACGAERE